VLAQAGLPRRRFHDLRHTCASLLLAQGVQARDIMETLGHSRIATTMDLYAHVQEPGRRAVARQMDTAFQALQGRADTQTAGTGRALSTGAPPALVVNLVVKVLRRDGIAEANRRPSL
jgi:hypothetical protein